MVYMSKMKSLTKTALLVFTFTINFVLYASSADSDNLVPLLNIGGTKLYTGIFYKVSMKVFPKGWLTWTSGANHIEVDLNPTELPKYATGEPYQYDNQWYFGADSDLGYTMTNRGKPLGFLLWVNAKVGSGNHVAVYDDPESVKKMSAGGEWRKDALWIPHKTNEGNFYKLENFAQKGSFLTWTYKKHNDFNYYIQLANYDAEEDAKFSFEPSNIKLEAKVFDFKFAETLDDLIKKENEGLREVVGVKRFPFRDSDVTVTVEESLQVKDSITIQFKESLPTMRSTKVSVDMLSYKDLLFDGGFEANQGITIEATKTLQLKTEIEIPSYSDIVANIYVIRTNNVEMPFTAKMQIFGFAERIVIGHPEKVQEGSVPADVVEDFIARSGMKLEGISRSGDNLVAQVSGILRGNIGIKPVLQKEDITAYTEKEAIKTDI